LAALILGKAVLIADLLPFINRYPDKPLVYNVVWSYCVMDELVGVLGAEKVRAIFFGPPPEFAFDADRRTDLPGARAGILGSDTLAKDPNRGQHWGCAVCSTLAKRSKPCTHWASRPRSTTSAGP
jgi:hypothetical protein